ncbi:unnamed protein product [Orchesella dallaii]|uniref:Uncharacterized protein n=1 Tax=Orchesella dallaii TaxID=48710 RepID=A0ABP1RJX7_9HEXA
MLRLLVNNATLNTNLLKNEKIRMFLSIWIFTAFVFTNFYGSANTAVFVVPERIQRITSVLETGKGFSIYSLIKNAISKEEYGEDAVLARETEFGEGIYEWVRSRYPLHTDTFLRDFENNNFKHASNVFNFPMLPKLSEIYRRIQHIFPRKIEDMDADISQVVPLLSNCDKTMFVSASVRINRIEAKLRKSQTSLPFYKGKNEFLPRYFVMAYDKKAGNYLKKQLANFLSSGQDIFWKDFLEDKPSMGEAKVLNMNRVEKPLSLRSNLVVIVYILIAGLGLGMVFFGFEMFSRVVLTTCAFYILFIQQPDALTYV